MIKIYQLQMSISNCLVFLKNDYNLRLTNSINFFLIHIHILYILNFEFNLRLFINQFHHIVCCFQQRAKGTVILRLLI